MTIGLLLHKHMTERKRFTTKFNFTATCPKCGQQRAVTASGRCPACNASLLEEEVVAVRAAVRSRRQAFKVRLNRLADRMHASTDAPPVFATRGSPQNKVDYSNKTLPLATNIMRERDDVVTRLLTTGEWNPDNPGSIEIFTELVQVLDAEIDFIGQLSQTMPTLELRGVHRELTRAAVQFARGHVFMAQTIRAADADEAARLMNEGANAITGASKHLKRTSDLFSLVKRRPSADPFRTDGSIDIAVLVWSAVNLKTTSIKDVAKQVRAAFADIPDVPRLSDHHATLLLPMLAVGAGVVDPEILTQRVRQLRSVIDRAGAPTTWVIEPSLLVDRVHRGIERFAEEIERLGREARYGLPRNHVIRSETEVYRNLVEGALRDLGGVVPVAARAVRGEDNRTYQATVIDGVKAGEIVNELERIGAPCGGAVNMLYRNASAHADVEVTDTGIVVTERRIEQGCEVSRDQLSLSDEEFAEDMVALQEILLALELAILPWLWSTSDAGLAVTVANAPVTKRQRDQSIALLGGIAGLYDLSMSVNGLRATITAAAHEDDADRRESNILTLVPAAFGVCPDVQQVSVRIAGLRPVVFDRTEFGESESGDIPHKLPMLGFTTARWLLESESAWTERDEATYITFPLTMLHFACSRLAGSSPPRTENVDQAVKSLNLVLSRLDQVLPADRRSQLTQRAVGLVTTLFASLGGLAEGRRGYRSRVESESLAQQAVATLQPMYEIQEAAKALRDG